MIRVVENKINLPTGDPLADAVRYLADNVGALAAAISELAKTQEKDIVTISKPSKATWGVADYNIPDPQTTHLRRQEHRNRTGDRGKTKTPPFGFQEAVGAGEEETGDQDRSDGRGA